MVDEDIEWDIDANLPMYTRDYLRLKKEGKLPDIDDKEMFRAAGEVQCPICERQWRDHPQADPWNCPTLMEACDGRLVKI